MESHLSNVDKKRKTRDVVDNGCNQSRSSGNIGNIGNNHRYKQQTTQNPKRGGPGILLTCETGREFKARREALQMLQQDWDALLRSKHERTLGDGDANPLTFSSSSATDPGSTIDKDQGKGITLDEELAQLQNDRSKFRSASHESPFTIYETGCKGTVLILYQNLNSPILPMTSANTSDSDAGTINDTVTDNASIETNQNRTQSTGTDAFHNAPNEKTRVTETGSKLDEKQNEWDPLLLVERIVHDMTLKSPNYTSSRYISRMIPIQTTCYATIEDVCIAVKSLLEAIVARHTSNRSKTSATFAIQEKRRFCNHMKREPLITKVGEVVGTVTKGNEWTVNLTKPDYTIWIDICKTVAGISIIHDMHLFPKNFNLVEHRISLDTKASNTEPTVVEKER
jgi:tRNA acetyltransferase TAN1